MSDFVQFIALVFRYTNTNKAKFRHLSIAELPSLLRTNWLVNKRVGPGNQEKIQSIRDSLRMVSSQKSTNDEYNYPMKMPGFTQFKPLKEMTTATMIIMSSVHSISSLSETRLQVNLCSIYTFIVTKFLSFNSQGDTYFLDTMLQSRISNNKASRSSHP